MKKKIQKLGFYDRFLLFAKRRIRVLVERDRLRFDLEEARRNNRWLAGENFRQGQEIIALKARMRDREE